MYGITCGLRLSFSFYVQYVQKSGICIGSSVAPILCDIFLASVDRSVNARLADSEVISIFRYVDDYLVVLPDLSSPDFDNIVGMITSVFTFESRGLTFTCERPSDNSMQFLDLKLTFNNDHVCYMYNPRTKKSLLPYDSAHTKLVKRGIAMSCVKSALAKSCLHTTSDSLNNQLRRLDAAGFPSSLVNAVCESVLQGIKKKEPDQQKERDRRRPQIPYIHRFSHNLKKVTQRYDVKVVFSAPCKLGQICPTLTKEKKKSCTKKHVHSYTDCVTHVVYKIPLSCGKEYIGQTGRCFNVRAREHFLNVKNNSGGHLADHCNKCKCTPHFDQATFIKHAKTKTEREIIEAAHIKKSGIKCVSTPSVYLSDKELQVMFGHP